MRDYGTARWEGGDADCPHAVPATGSTQNKGNNGKVGTPFVGDCGLCGAIRIDAQIGLEPTPEDYVATMVAVFREVRRVLRDDGTVWLNLGDSYAGIFQEPRANMGLNQRNFRTHDGMRTPGGLKPKDLCGIPWRVAFALQADGWYLRSDIIWAKPNPMPESVTDRPTRAHEYVFLLSKSERYFYDADAIREVTGNEATAEEYAAATRTTRPSGGIEKYAGSHKSENAPAITHPNGRNKRSVWTVNSEPTSGRADFDEADYVGESGKPYKASPGCPIHAPLANRRTQQKAECGEQLSVAALRSLDNDCRLAFVRQLAPVSRQPLNNGDLSLCNESTRNGDSKHESRTPLAPLPCAEGDLDGDEQTESRTDRTEDSTETMADSSDSRDRASAPTASVSSNGTRKKPRARTVTARGNAVVETDDDIARIRPRPFETGSADHNGANRTFAFDSVDHPSAETNARIADNPSFLNDTCKCSESQQAHFATFPQKLIEPCILAGSRAGDLVLDPFLGSGTVGKVAERFGRRWVGLELSGAYIQIAEKRTAQMGMQFGSRA